MGMLLRRHNQEKGEELPLPNPENEPEIVKQAEEPVDLPAFEAPRRRGRPRKHYD